MKSRIAIIQLILLPQSSLINIELQNHYFGLIIESHSLLILCCVVICIRSAHYCTMYSIIVIITFSLYCISNSIVFIRYHSLQDIVLLCTVDVRGNCIATEHDSCYFLTLWVFVPLLQVPTFSLLFKHTRIFVSFLY